ncbi:MAG: 2-oxo acid dehydrogenase subunit E2 [Anaerolineae bacterium]|nr:2-oxo acid dehydrogenase subunit E2 [Anaerolineae bacterium]RIK23468.1 MAG: 2-oxo acid dehydrogenase subunit E2 [Anaerolineae bacterium]
MAYGVTLPEMGEGVIEGTLSRWLVKEGDRIEQYAPIAEVETDKVTTETTSESGGVVLKLLVNEGQTVPVGTVLAYIGEAGENIPGNGATKDALPKLEAASDSPQEEQQAPPATPAIATGGVYTGRISPVVGRIASEHGVDLGQIVGTGRDGRITKEDVLAYIEAGGKAVEPQPAEVKPQPEAKQQPQAVPAERQEPVTPRQASLSPVDGAVDLLPLTSIRRSIAEHMVRSKHVSPHVTTVFEIDFAAVAAHRKAYKDSFARDGARLTFTAYIVAATVHALKVHPLVNSSWSDEGILLRREINIGMATAIDDGLIVPVIKHADSLNLLGLARTINDLADRARGKQLRPEDVKGGTFSITNHGTTGSLFATPIINQPQCGILGVGAIEKRVKVIDDAIAIRPMAYISFAFDHRILDGASADNFVSTIKKQIENWA